MVDLFSQYIRYDDGESLVGVPILPKAECVSHKALTKEEERRIKNRAAALSSRQRKKERLEDLEQLVVKLTEENILLKRTIDGLKRENESLKKHSCCSSALVPPPMSPESLSHEFDFETDVFLGNSVNGSILAFGVLVGLVLWFLNPIASGFLGISEFGGRSLLATNALTNTSPVGTVVLSDKCLARPSFTGLKLLDLYEKVQPKRISDRETPSAVALLLGDAEQRPSNSVVAQQTLVDAVPLTSAALSNTFVCNHLIKLSEVDWSDGSGSRISMVLPLGSLHSPKSMALFQRPDKAFNYVKLDLAVLDAQLVKYSDFFC